MVDKYEKYKYNIALCFDLAATHFEEELQGDINDCCAEILKCFDELAEYKKIGTVEELQVLNRIAEETAEYVKEDKKILEAYKIIGTIEEFKALKEDKKFLEFLYNHILPNEMEQYLSMYHIKEKIAVNGYADQSGLMSAT